MRNEQGVRQPIRFQGQWLDEESGFYYNRYRYYDPGQGRYITQDPIGLKGGLNVYSYPTDPVGCIDPWGLVDINMYPSNEAQIHGAANQINILGVFTVGGHGNPLKMSDETGMLLTPQQLATRIKNHPLYSNGMPVRLFSCNTAKGGEGSFASQLAKELGPRVTGADEFWWARGNGNVGPAKALAPNQADTNGLGNWVTFDSTGKEVSKVPGQWEIPANVQ